MPGRRQDRAKMTPWYDPPALLRTAIRVVTSTYFGHLVDRRDIMASLDPFDEKDFRATHDYSSEDELWLDYTADLGDGWNPAFAVARLLAEPQLAVEGCETPLPRGRVLVFGGDEVYPWPTLDEYRRKLEAPFLAANKALPASEFDIRSETFREPHYLYAIPGNHDWYDGLSAFTARFCARRPGRDGQMLANQGHAIAGRHTRQTRSYFAIKLPGGWWLCGIDVQLGGSVDDEQLAYFHYVAQRVMEHGSNVILAVPNPQWAYATQENADDTLGSLAYAAAVIGGDVADVSQRDQASYRYQEPAEDGLGRRRHFIRLMLSGDSHFYARHVEGEETPAGNGAGIQYIICGLGGAFMHPTSWLPRQQTIRWDYPPPRPLARAKAGDGTYHRTFVRKAAWPSAETCQRLNARNFLFGFNNPQFSLAMAGVSFLVAWLLISASRVTGFPLFERFGHGPVLPSLAGFIGDVLFATPWPLLVTAGVFAALYRFAATGTRRKYLSAGLWHAAVQTSLYLIAFALAARGANALAQAYGSGLDAGTQDPWSLWLSAVLLAAFMAAYGFLGPPLIFGAYLWGMLTFLKAHWNEAFSALRIADYKGFLRLHVDEEGVLTVYPVGVAHIPRAASGALAPKLIEAPIRLAPLRMEERGD